ncbi:hypothetical protein [Saccharopolyspora sp. 5N708]|uniref:hypothetical protein n=1 Tax=Saccharopolyspora sp. 5N708 TaxID=3457424 RepID=UPI003FCF6248
MSARTTHAKAESVEIRLQTGDQLVVAVEDSDAESYVISCLASNRDVKCEPCEFDPDEARHVAQAMLDLQRSKTGPVEICIPRTGDQLTLAMEGEGDESYLIAHLGNDYRDGHYEPSEFGPEEVRLVARAFRDLADVAEQRSGS